MTLPFFFLVLCIQRMTSLFFVFKMRTWPSSGLCLYFKHKLQIRGVNYLYIYTHEYLNIFYLGVLICRAGLASSETMNPYPPRAYNPYLFKVFIWWLSWGKLDQGKRVEWVMWVHEQAYSLLPLVLVFLPTKQRIGALLQPLHHLN